MTTRYFHAASRRSTERRWRRFGADLAALTIALGTTSTALSFCIVFFAVSVPARFMAWAAVEFDRAVRYR